jgi:hypothetical protein
VKRDGYEAAVVFKEWKGGWLVGGVNSEAQRKEWIVVGFNL